MLFNSVQFALFFVFVLALHRAAPPARRNGVLLGASLVFYLSWVPGYLLLLLGDAAVNFLLLRRIAGSRSKGPWLALSVTFSLGVLATFKYAAFMLGAASPVLEWAIGRGPLVPDILLPLGISFYTFQMIGLAVDTRRGHVDPPESFREYLLFVAFFPQLVAGPILRGAELLPQIRGGAAVDPERTRRGGWLLASGAIKKVVLGDFLLAPFVDFAFEHPGADTAPIRLLGLYSFAFQIYFDFSGYTDMARGLALLLGFELPANFKEPYLSRDPSEFWRRWHITLSRWLRDYVYIPLGGNRRVPTRVLGNLMVTMTLGGLWHGAGWNFVIWGALHGLLLVGHRLVAGQRRSSRTGEPTWRDVPSVAALFHAVLLLWVFFRSATPTDAWRYLETIFTGSYAAPWPVAQLVIVALCMAAHVAERWARLHAEQLRASLATPAGRLLEPAALGATLAVAFWVGGRGEAFIYFQF